MHNTVLFSYVLPPPSRLTIIADTIRFTYRPIFLLQKLWGMTPTLILSLHVVLIGIIDHSCSPQKLLNLAIKQRRILLAKITPRRKVHHFLPPFIHSIGADVHNSGISVQNPNAAGNQPGGNLVRDLLRQAAQYAYQPSSCMYAHC